MTDPERIAAGLTEAQQRVMLSLPKAYGRWWAPIGWLLKKGLIFMAAARQPVGKSYDRALWDLTDAGHAVRKVLENRHEG